MTPEFPQPHAPHALAPGRVSLTTVRPRIAALRGPVLRVSSLYLGYGALGLLLAAGLGGHDIALMYLGALGVLYGSALAKAIQAVPTARRGDATDGA